MASARRRMEMQPFRGQECPRHTLVTLAREQAVTAGLAPDEDSNLTDRSTCERTVYREVSVTNHHWP